MAWLNGITFVLFLVFGGLNAGRFVRDVGELVEQYDYNRLLLENIPRPYFVVLPTQVRHKDAAGAISTKEHKLRHHGTHEHMKHVMIQLQLNGKKIKIRLERNDALLSSGILVKHYTDSNQQIITKTVEHCYYHGEVKKDEWSNVAVSTCHGIRGVIQMHNETYIIQPLMGGDEGMEHPHVLYKATVSEKEKCGNTAGLWLPFHELHKGEFIKRLKFLNAQRHSLGIDSDEPKILRLGLVLDKFMYMGLNFSQQLVSRYAMEIANIVDMYYRDLRFHIALSYLEYWDIADRFIVSTQQRELLEKFQNYKTSSLPKDAFDVALFLTGINLDDNSIGMAVPDSVCSERAVGIVKSGKPFEPQQTAASVAHMVGHTLGIDHDEDGGCDCSDTFGCIMSVQVLQHNGLHSRMFSTCSKSDLDISLSMGITSCLQGAPAVAVSLSFDSQFTQTCGNSIVERGEECDCGSVQDCELSDPCCDAHTCLLKYWAQCRSGPCCANCTVLDRSHMCRDRQSECDVPEFCDGVTGNCPFNTYIEDGHPCASGSGYCMGGICPTLDQQCVGIWGEGAEGGSQQCYQRFNPTGNFNGHCGKDRSTGNYAKCEQENILCGLLHCAGGMNAPLYGSDKGFSKTTVSAHGVEYQCKTVHGPTMMDMPHMGLVQHGTRCRDRHICQNNRCLPLPSTPQLNCPATNATTVCSGNGVCTPIDACFCNVGWTGVDCAQEVNMTTPPPPPPGPMVALTTDPEPTPLVRVVPLPLDEDMLKKTSPLSTDVEAAPVPAESPAFSTTLLIIILATVIGGLVLVLGITLICYRRRTPLKYNSQEKDAEKNAKSRNNRSVKKKKWLSSEDESELGELPPPPVIISDPNSLMPEKGILKNSCPRLPQIDSKRGSDSGASQGQRGSESGASYQDSVGPYLYDEDEDIEAAEIREIFRDQAVGNSFDNLDNMPESASFDFVIPPPPHFHLQSIFPSPPLMEQHCTQTSSMDFDAHPLMWRTPLPPQTLSPPQSRIVRLRNFSDLMARFDKTMVDLSPSPDELPVQLSPSTCTSEDVRSSETEPDRGYYRTSHSDHSPTSIASSSTTQHTLNNGRPSFGSANQYMLKHNNLSAVTAFERVLDDEANGIRDIDDDADDMPSRPVHMPPPMHPINIRTILGLGHNSNTSTANSRDSNDTSHGGDSGPATASNTLKGGLSGYEKSSGYGSEHDPGERFSMDDSSHHSRSQSTSPPSYSAVIRTGPNQIQLVAPGHFLNGCKESGSQDELQRLLENLPRIDAGSFERSPLQVATPSTPCTGPIPPSKPFPKDQPEDPSNTPCIDRSLEEIPQVFGKEEEKKSRNRRSFGKKSKRPISLCVNHKGASADSQSSSRETIQEVSGKKLPS